MLSCHIVCLKYFDICIQCLDAAGSVARRASWLQWYTGIVVCLEQGVDDLHMVQLMPLPPHHLCFRKMPNSLSFWYRLAQVVLEKWLLNECCCYVIIVADVIGSLSVTGNNVGTTVKAEQQGVNGKSCPTHPTPTERSRPTSKWCTFYVSKW